MRRFGSNANTYATSTSIWGWMVTISYARGGFALITFKVTIVFKMELIFRVCILARVASLQAHRGGKKKTDSGEGDPSG